MYNQTKMVYYEEDEEVPNLENETKENVEEKEVKAPVEKTMQKQEETMQKKEKTIIKNIYETEKFLTEDVMDELTKNKKVCMYKFHNCGDYDKPIFERIYKTVSKHLKILQEFYKELYQKEYDKEDNEQINYKKYTAEKFIINFYDLLDDLLKIYTNLENPKQRDMINEMIQDTQKNMILLSLVYTGEE